MTGARQPSEHFFDAIRCAGSIRHTCGCGRTHFTRENNDWEKGEFEELTANAKAAPDLFVFHEDADFVEIGEFIGQTFVIGCVCNYKLVRYEDWIWAHRYAIARYLTARSTAEKSAANLEHALLGGLEKEVVNG